jgi:hypothetical protein
MHAMETDRLVDDYLRRLEHAAAHMQRARRAELVAEIRGHIEAALRQEPAAGEAAVRNVLDRLGPPEDIVEAAEPPPEREQGAGKLEIAALIILIVPFIGWLIGTVLVFASRVWSRRDKLIGALLLLAPILVLSLGFIAAGPSGSEESAPPGETHPVGEKVEDTSLAPGPAELVLFVAGLPTALYLGWQLRRDPATRPTEP